MPLVYHSERLQHQAPTAFKKGRYSLTDKTQKDVAEKALAMKNKDASSQDYLEHQEKTVGEGPISERNRIEPVSGALGAEGHRPVLERSRKER